MLNEGVVDFRAEFGAVAMGLSLLGLARVQRNSSRGIRWNLKRVNYPDDRRGI